MPPKFVDHDCFDILGKVLALSSVDFIFDQQCFHCLRTVDDGGGEARAVEVIREALKPGGHALVIVGKQQKRYFPSLSLAPTLA